MTTTTTPPEVRDLITLTLVARRTANTYGLDSHRTASGNLTVRGREAVATAIAYETALSVILGITRFNTSEIITRTIRVFAKGQPLNDLTDKVLDLVAELPYKKGTT